MVVKRRTSCQCPSKRGKTFLATATVLLAVAAVSVLGAAGCGDVEKELVAESLSLTDVAAYWSVRGRDEEGNNYIRPVIRFRIKNGAADEVGYVQAMAVFRRESFPDEPWGNAFLYSVSEEPIPAGGASDVITLRADTNFISKDEPEQMFHNEKWEEVSVSVFLRVGPSSWKPTLESIEVPKRIGAPGLDKFLNPDEPDPAEAPDRDDGEPHSI